MNLLYRLPVDLNSFSSGIVERAREEGDTWMKVPIRLRIGPLQLAIHVVQNCHAGEQQKAYIILTCNFLCLAANCVLPHFSRPRDSKNERIRRTRDTWRKERFFRM